jgi:magnesium chelatase accessory protein
MRAGPLVLLLHGAGGSTHSFRDLMPLLATGFRVVALDLPGQGFTQLGARHRSGLEHTAEDIATLAAQEDWQPCAIIGHSAGGALALRLSQRLLSPRGQAPKVIGINPALDNFKGLAGVLFPALAKLLAAVPFTAQMVSASAANPDRIQSLISSTGSNISTYGQALYGQLISDRDHADATLTMMSQWSLDGLRADFPQMDAEALFIVGDKDKTVPPQVAVDAARQMPNVRVEHMPEAGHLAHEEEPKETARLIRAFLTSNP